MCEVLIDFNTDNSVMTGKIISMHERGAQIRRGEPSAGKQQA